MLTYSTFDAFPLDKACRCSISNQHNQPTVCCAGSVHRAYRGLALKHHPDKALQQCRWSYRLGRCGAAAAHGTAALGGIDTSLKAAATEVFALLSAAHEQLINPTSRRQVCARVLVCWAGVGPGCELMQIPDKCAAVWALPVCSTGLASLSMQTGAVLVYLVDGKHAYHPGTRMCMHFG